jgi:hypothetical protein
MAALRVRSAKELACYGLEGGDILVIALEQPKKGVHRGSIYATFRIKICFNETSETSY